MITNVKPVTKHPRCKGKSQQTHQNWYKFHLFENAYNVQNYSKCHNTSYVSLVDGRMHHFRKFHFSILTNYNLCAYWDNDSYFRLSIYCSGVIPKYWVIPERNKWSYVRSKSQLGVRLWKAINSVQWIMRS